MNHKHAGLIAAAVVAAAGTGTGLALAAGGTTSPGTTTVCSAATNGYSWYRSMMGGTSYGWMMGGPRHRPGCAGRRCQGS